MSKLRIKILKWMKKYSFEEISKEYCKKYGCDSACPRCKVWESEGNTIYTEPLESGDLDKRTCTNCENVWYTIFTPMGHTPVDYKPNKE